MAKRDVLGIDNDMTPDDYERIIADLKSKLKDSETYNDKLKISLELQDAKQAKNRIPDLPIISTGPSFNPMNILDKTAEPYLKTGSDQQFRYISTNPNLYALRRSQGYEPVKDAKGDEVRHMDAVLAKMPKARFEKEVVEPRKNIREMKKAAIDQRFHDVGAELGVTTFEGKIKYDGDNR